MSRARRKAPASTARPEAPASIAAKPRAPAWHWQVAVAVAFLAYAPALHNDYTLDDHLIAETSADRAHASFSTLFDRSYFDRYNQDTYRPVATFCSMVGHRLGADPIVAGHVQNGL